MLAVLLKTTPIIRKLIDVGADLELCDSLGNNIIHLAAEYGNDSSLIEMFTASKFTNLQYLSKTYEVLLESRNYQGISRILLIWYLPTNLYISLLALYIYIWSRLKITIG